MTLGTNDVCEQRDLESFAVLDNGQTSFSETLEAMRSVGNRYVDRVNYRGIYQGYDIENKKASSRHLGVLRVTAARPSY